jgi:hypothetical protein
MADINFFARLGNLWSGFVSLWTDQQVREAAGCHGSHHSPPR